MDWEVHRMEGGRIAFKAPTGAYLRASSGIANPEAEGLVDLGPTPEPFQIIANPDGSKTVALQTRHGSFLNVVEGKRGIVNTAMMPQFSFALVEEGMGRVSILTQYRTYLRSNPPAAPVSHWSVNLLKPQSDTYVDQGKDYWAHMRPQQTRGGG